MERYRTALSVIYRAPSRPQAIFRGLTTDTSGREYPVERQDSKQPRLGCFPMPAAVGIRAGEIFVPEYSHRLVFRERRVIAFLL
jgi:hypothetical protein